MGRLARTSKSVRTMDNCNISKPEVLLKILEMNYKDEAEHIQLFHNNVKFFAGFILTVIGGVLLVNMKGDSSMLANISYFAGGIVVVAGSILGYCSARSAYRRHLEAIIERAKIQDLLGYSNLVTQSVWKGENLFSIRHSIDRNSRSDSYSFLKYRLNRGMMIIIAIFYGLTVLMGSVLIAVGALVQFEILAKLPEFIHTILHLANLL